MVCEIGPAKRAPPMIDLPFEPTHSGPVEVEVEGNRMGRSQVVFTYQVGQNIHGNGFKLIQFMLMIKLTASECSLDN